MSITVTEDVSSQINGFTATFVTGIFVPGSLVVEFNGQRLRPGSGHDYVETSSSSFELDLVPHLGEALLVQYETVASETGFPLVVAYSYDPTVI